MKLDDLYTIVYNIKDSKDTNAIALLGRAISSPIRIKILDLLGNSPMKLSDIADALDIQVSSAAIHMDILLDAGIVSVDNSIKHKGHVKFFSYVKEKSIVVNLRNIEKQNNKDKKYVYKINIGDYTDAELHNFGFASEECMLNDNDEQMVFVDSRHKAQALWAGKGWVKYTIPNNYTQDGDIEKIDVTLEICSEAIGYNHTFPSEISFYLNDTKLCTYLCPGDFGDRYGKYTPSWWYKESTKYGMLTNICVTKNGVFLNGKSVNTNVDIQSLDLSKGNKTTLKISVDDDAKHQGGFNLFGEKFGDYNIPIVFTVYYKE